MTSSCTESSYCRPPESGTRFASSWLSTAWPRQHPEADERALSPRVEVGAARSADDRVRACFGGGLQRQRAIVGRNERGDRSGHELDFGGELLDERVGLARRRLAVATVRELVAQREQPAAAWQVDDRAAGDERHHVVERVRRRERHGPRADADERGAERTLG